MDLHKLFYPRNVAVVGASPNFGGGKIPFYQFIQAAGYKGNLYPVNPKHEEIKGVKVYKTLAGVPDGVDLAIASVPARFALETVEMAVAKDIPFIHFFTSGFSEVGNHDLEAALLEAARKGRTRIVGPNCLGALCSESGVTFDPNVHAEGTGEVAFLGQSGGVTENFIRAAQSRRLEINKVVSYGNQIDLRIEHFLEYFAKDDTIKAVAAYIEDIKDGRAFLEAVKKTTAKKPMVVLKGGSTDAGARAAQSHTGAMAGRYEIWSAALAQRGAVMADDPEQMLDIVMAACSNKLPPGPRIGFFGAGGGTSVLFTDLAVKQGLEMPELSPETQKRIAEKIPDVNTSTRNPVDLGAFGFDARVMNHTMRSLDDEPRVDTLVAYFALDFMSLFPDEMIDQGLAAITKAAASTKKPVMPVVFKSNETDRRLESIRIKTLKSFRAAGLPIFFTLPAAVQGISRVLRWSAGR